MATHSKAQHVNAGKGKHLIVHSEDIGTNTDTSLANIKDINALVENGKVVLTL